MGCQGVLEVRGLAVSPVVPLVTHSFTQVAAAPDFFFCSLKQRIQQPPCADVPWRIIESQQKARCYSSVTDVSSAGRDVIPLLLLFLLRQSVPLSREETRATSRLQPRLGLGVTHGNRPMSTQSAAKQHPASGLWPQGSQ